MTQEARSTALNVSIQWSQEHSMAALAISHLLLAALLLGIMAWRHGKRAVYLVDFYTFRPPNHLARTAAEMYNSCAQGFVTVSAAGPCAYLNANGAWRRAHCGMHHELNFFLYLLTSVLLHQRVAPHRGHGGDQAKDNLHCPMLELGAEGGLLCCCVLHAMASASMPNLRP